jgi:hypothetical protein
MKVAAMKPAGARLAAGRPPYGLWIAMAAWLFAPQAARPGSASNPGRVNAEREAGRQLKSRLQDALRRGSPQLVVPAGTYRIAPDSPDSPHITLANVSHFQLLGEQATIVCETKNTALLLERCSDVKISGITIDYDPLPMTQGTVTKVARSGEGSSVDFVVHKGYDQPDYDGRGVGHIWIVDAATRRLKPGCQNYGAPQAILKIGTGEYRLVYQHPRHDAAAPGDLIKLPQRLNLKAPHAVRLSQCEAVAVKNVTIRSAPCFGLTSSLGDGITLENVRVVPGPVPPGASQQRIFSSSADAINLSNNRTGPVIRHCAVTSSGDDGIAVYNQPAFIYGKKNDTTLIVGLNWGRSADYRPGDLLRFFLFKAGKTAERRLLASLPARTPPDFEDIKRRHLKAPRKNSLQTCIEVALDAPLDAEAGDMLLNASYAGQGFEISGNVLVDVASRGINACQSGGLVKNNDIRHTYLSGIQVAAFMKDGGSGSGFQHAVAIADNELADTCIGFSQEKNWQGAVSVVNWDSQHPFPDGHRDISITGNSIDKPNGVGIKVQCASKVVVARNRFGSPGVRRRGDAAILLDAVGSAKLFGNALFGPAWVAPTAELAVSASCHDVDAEIPVIVLSGDGPGRTAPR